jgi:hypothetical protein
MIGVLIAVSLLAAQGIPVSANQSGTVTGVLRNAAGTPAASVRVSALTSPDTNNELASSMALASLTETDASGRYRLENIPPGRYYIVAGNIDVPTFYPGVVRANDGVVIRITPGLLVPGIDFVLNNASVGRAASGSPGRPSWVIPIQARIEDGGQIPIFAGGRFPTLRLTQADGARVETGLTSSNITVTALGWRATIENLPDGYVVKSFTFGSANLNTTGIQLGSLVPTLPTVVPVPQAISIVLERLHAQPLPGVRISGRIRGNPNRSIYISGIPGTLYPDGTFEFLGVLAGRQAIMTLDNPDRGRPLGASLIVGDRDMANVELEETSILPFAAGLRQDRELSRSLPSPTSRVPLATIRGRVFDGVTREPFDAGRIIVNGDQSITFRFESDGRFEIRKLLPGSYSLEIVAYGIGNVRKEVVMDDKDIDLDVGLTSDR